jgi:DNA-binding response OmpR family regulator
MANERPILIVEDDDSLRETLADQLTISGEFSVTQAASIQAAASLLSDQDNRFDAVILDLHLPDGDGRDFCRLLRQQGHKMPIIMLTGSDGDIDVVQGLDAGASDYVTKPCNMAILTARLRGQMRTFENSQDAVFAIGSYTFHPGSKLLREPAKKRRIPLTQKEVGLLKFLYRAGGEMVDRQTLLNEVWGYNAGVTTHTLETHIYRLRQKIEIDPAAVRLVVTQNGGYRLNLAQAEAPAYA